MAVTVEYNEILSNYSTKIEKHGDDAFTITLNDKTFSITVLDVKNNIITFLIGEQLYKANVTERQGSLIITLLNSSIRKTHKVTLERKSFKSSSKKPKNILYAPLAGRIIKTYVSPNEYIRKNQELLVIESMKMENEIRSEVDGFVKTIPIKEGDLVQSEQTLITFEIKDDHKGDSDEERKAQNWGRGKRAEH